MGGIIGNFKTLADTVIEQLVAGQTVNLTATPRLNASVVVKNSSAGAITVSGDGKNIEAAATLAMAAGEAVRFWFNGTVWRIVGKGDTFETIEQWVAPPANSTATGIKGQTAFGDGYLYQCIETNTWVRQPVETSF